MAEWPVYKLPSPSFKRQSKLKYNYNVKINISLEYAKIKIVGG